MALPSTTQCKEYIENHAKPLIIEYKARVNKKKREFFGWQMAILIAGAGITIINIIPVAEDPWIQVVSTIFGASIVVMTGLTQLLRAHELWVLFGLTQVRLDSELRLYLNNAGEYSGKTAADRCELFVKNFEALRFEAAQQSWTIAAKKS